jgi:hypothetical protein
MAATVPFDMLAEIQGWAPAGGFVRSEWRNGMRLEPGDLMRHDGAWAVITEWEIVSRIDVATREVVASAPAIAWRDMNGNIGARILWAAESDGAEVRTDTRIDSGTIPAG